MQIPCTGIPEIKQWTFCVFRGQKRKKISKFQNSGLRIKKLRIACYLAENMQIPCTGIPEIKLLTFCVFRGLKRKIPKI